MLITLFNSHEITNQILIIVLEGTRILIIVLQLQTESSSMLIFFIELNDSCLYLYYAIHVGNL